MVGCPSRKVWLAGWIWFLDTEIFGLGFYWTMVSAILEILSKTLSYYKFQDGSSISTYSKPNRGLFRGPVVKSSEIIRRDFRLLFGGGPVVVKRVA